MPGHTVKRNRITAGSHAYYTVEHETCMDQEPYTVKSDRPSIWERLRINVGSLHPIALIAGVVAYTIPTACDNMVYRHHHGEVARDLDPEPAQVQIARTTRRRGIM